VSDRPRYLDPDEITADDPGLAAERTTLAWGRSTMSLFACGAAVAKGVPRVTGHGRPLVGISMLALGGVMWLCGLPFAKSRRAAPGLRRLATHIELAPLAYGTAVVGAAAFVVAALFPN